MKARPTTRPRRVSVVGCSGSGKSTVARRLADALGTPYVELDALHWGPDWSEPSPEDFRARVGEAIEGETWVCDGNYRGKLGDLVWRRVDTVVWLDPPRWRATWQSVSRTLRRAITREELWSGNRESWRGLMFWRGEQSILWWAWTSFERTRRRYGDAMADPRNAYISFHRLRTRREVAVFLRDAGTAPATGLFVVSGLPGVGKTEVTRRLAAELGAVHLSVDPVEDAMLGAGSPPGWETGVAAYEAVRAMAETNLAEHAVVVDAVNDSEAARETWRRAARATSSPVTWIVLTCSDATEHARRLAGRHRGFSHVGEPGWEDVLARAAAVEPWSEEAEVIDTAGLAVEDVVQAVSVRLTAGSQRDTPI